MSSSVEQLKQLYKEGKAEIADFIEAADLLAEEGHEHGEFLCELATEAATTEDRCLQTTCITMFLSLIGYEKE